MLLECVRTIERSGSPMTQQEQKGLFEFSELTDEGDTELTYEGDINELKAQGLKYVPNFLSPEEQRATLKCIDDEPWLKDLSRRVQHYGYRYDYRARRVDKSMHIGDLPFWAKVISDRLKVYYRLPCSKNLACLIRYC